MSELKKEFIKANIPADHYSAYKAGAAYGYLVAKRQMIEAIDSTLQNIDNENRMSGTDDNFIHSYPIEDLRDYVRNAMLWRNE